MTNSPGNDSSPCWSALRAHHGAMAEIHMRDLFSSDPGRSRRLRLEAGGLLLDYSRHRVSGETLKLLTALAAERRVDEWIRRLMAGEALNNTERRAALHTALRHTGGGPFPAAGDVMPKVQGQRAKMRDICERVRARRWRGITERPVDTIVMLGIGGSHLGPFMACAALEELADPGLAIRFVSDLDGTALSRVLSRCDPERTLFIVASKSFSTLETLTNARSARRWMEASLGGGRDVMARHFLAVTARPERAVAFGIDAGNVLEIWDWVGGRYSLWSAMGLPVALAVGMDAFEALLEGAADMDAHFSTAGYAENLPVILALLEIWYRNFFGAGSRVVLTYDHALKLFTAYLQQLEMESNGKRVGRDGEALTHATAPVVWGGPGVDAQHAFFQLLHQGGDLIPAEFIVPLESRRPLEGHHDALVASALAQARALMRGRSEAEVKADRDAREAAAGERDLQVPHRVHPGNQPSSLLIYERLDPRTLGALCALYEHKVFVESVLWGINPFDQYGVELGKTIAEGIRPAVSQALDTGRRKDNSLSARLDRLVSAFPADDG